mmetsp:Transcript_15495/g.48163  ORF Transcript_15495/g.48163 Transcript_15495/m.48163 type:complete len:225 (+) Transcript_15495:211-885(+)
MGCSSVSSTEPLGTATSGSEPKASNLRRMSRTSLARRVMLSRWSWNCARISVSMPVLLLEPMGTLISSGRGSSSSTTFCSSISCVRLWMAARVSCICDMRSTRASKDSNSSVNWFSGAELSPAWCSDTSAWATSTASNAIWKSWMSLTMPCSWGGTACTNCCVKAAGELEGAADNTSTGTGRGPPTVWTGWGATCTGLAAATVTGTGTEAATAGATGAVTTVVV